MEVRVYVINKKTHVHSQLHSLSKKFIVTHTLHLLDLLLPCVLKLYLDSLDGKEESEKLIVFFDSVLVKEEMERPLDIVIK